MKTKPTMNNTLKLVLDRRWKKDTYTIGILTVNGKYFCETVEDKDRGLSSDMPVNVIKHGKVYGLTAIPTGTYNVDMNIISPKFKAKSWAKKYGGVIPRLAGVPCWSGVLIHPGNTAADTEGCILVGENKVKGGVTKSVETWCRLMDEYLWPAKLRGEKVYITIK